jgi:hypothetical protein
MSDWLLEKYLNVYPEFNSNELTIWVLHADKTPPHIGVSIEESFYSLKINGKDDGLAVDSLLQLIVIKQIPTLGITLNTSMKHEQIKSVFSTFGSKIGSNETCLSPIVKLLTPQLNDLILIELLSELDKQEQIKSVYSFYLPHGYVGIPNYTRETIQQRIHAIQPTQR